MKKYKGAGSAGEAGQQAFTSEADRAMSKKHLRDRIAMDKEHMREHQQLAAKQKKMLVKVKKQK